MTWNITFESDVSKNGETLQLGRATHHRPKVSLVRSKWPEEFNSSNYASHVLVTILKSRALQRCYGNTKSCPPCVNTPRHKHTLLCTVQGQLPNTENTSRTQVARLSAMRFFQLHRWLRWSRRPRWLRRWRGPNNVWSTILIILNFHD